jgi:hypothetical protein
VVGAASEPSMSEISASSSSSRKATMVFLSLSSRVRLVDQREEKMFERRELMLALVRLPESVVDGGFEGARKRGHSPRPSGRTRRPVRAGVGQVHSQLPITS